MTTTTSYNIVNYFLEDYPRTLFPLSTTKVLVENNSQDLLEFIYEKVLNQSESEFFFISQVKCYASKHGLHLRRTAKLDPVAELFIYDFVYRNRASFRKDFNSNRHSFGYRFEQGKPISAIRSYATFKQAISEARKKFTYSAKFDIAAYFNSLYHHDLVSWCSEGGRSAEDTEYLGQFLREINGGRTVDCLPHGLHPCKVIGAEFLKFIDNSFQLQSELMLRYMDDFYMFSNNEHVLSRDFIIIQKMLGEKGLSLNTNKTYFGYGEELDIKKEVDEIKANLLRLRRTLIEVSGNILEEYDDKGYDDEGYDDEGYDEEEYDELEQEQIEYLLTLLKDPDINESDTELVLSLLHEYSSEVLQYLDSFLRKFPSLTRQVYNYSRYVTNTQELSNLVLNFLKTGDNITEDQLFWMAKIAESYLNTTPNYPEILSALYNHPNATIISKAKILEIPELRFGMPELRAEHLRVGKSDWLAWSAAVGCRNETKIKRNHILKYFSHASPMNRLIARCVTERP